VTVSLISLELDVTNVNPENMEKCAINSVLHGVKGACVKKNPEIVHTDVLKIRSLVINVTFVQQAGMDNTVTYRVLLAVKTNNARKKMVNAQMDVLKALKEKSAINACLASVILFFSGAFEEYRFFRIFNVNVNVALICRPCKVLHNDGGEEECRSCRFCCW
jgi:hypothetical protein